MDGVPNHAEWMRIHGVHDHTTEESPEIVLAKEYGGRTLYRIAVRFPFHELFRVGHLLQRPTHVARPAQQRIAAGNIREGRCQLVLHQAGFVPALEECELAGGQRGVHWCSVVG